MIELELLAVAASLVSLASIGIAGSIGYLQKPTTRSNAAANIAAPPSIQETLRRITDILESIPSDRTLVENDDRLGKSGWLGYIVRRGVMLRPPVEKCDPACKLTRPTAELAVVFPSAWRPRQSSALTI